MYIGEIIHCQVKSHMVYVLDLSNSQWVISIPGTWSV